MSTATAAATRILECEQCQWEGAEQECIEEPVNGDESVYYCPKCRSKALVESLDPKFDLAKSLSLVKVATGLYPNAKE